MTLQRCLITLTVLVAPFLTSDVPVRADENNYTPEDARAWIELSEDQLNFSPGDVLGPNDLDKLETVLVAPYISMLRFPELEIEIAPTGDYSPHEAYFVATKQFSGQSQIAEDGTLLHYVAGQPFSTEAAEAESPERAGLMMAWNYNFRYQHFGQMGTDTYMLYIEPGSGAEESFNDIPKAMLSGGGKLVRFLQLEFERAYFNHISLLPNSGYRFNLQSTKHDLWKDRSEYQKPESFRGEKFLIERSLDWKEDDTLNAYLPNSRKVRRLSAKERTDSFLGSEMTLEDLYGFDGQIPDYNWRYLGRKQILVVMNSKHLYPHYYGPQSRIPHDRWEIRECLVLEHDSKYDYHPYKTQFLFIDVQNYQATLHIIFDQKDKLLRGWFPVYEWTETTKNRPEKNRGARVSGYKGDMMQNFQTGNNNVYAIVNSTYPRKEARKVERRYSIDNLTAGR